MKKKGGILLLLSQFIISTVLLPFFASPVHADTLVGQDAVGTDVSYTAVDSIQYQGSSSGLLVYWNTGTVHLRWKLKKPVIGVVRLQFEIDYYTRVNNQWTTDRVTEIVNAKLNGDTFEYEFNLNSFGPLMYTWMDVDNNNAHTDNPIKGWGTTILNSNVTFYDDLTDLQGIIDILQDIYSDTTNLVGLSGDQLTELQTILQNCQAMGITLTDIDNQLIDVNSVLDYISQIRQYNVPFESLVYNLNLFQRYPSDLYSQLSYNYFDFPLYRFTSSKLVFFLYTDANVQYDWIFITDCSQPAQLRNYMNISNANASVTFDYFSNLGNVANYGYVYIYHCTVVSSVNSATNITVDFSQGSPNLFAGVLINRKDYKYYSTDFALRFGLSNQLLDDLHLIAQGTQQSNTSANNLEDNNDQMASDMGNLATIENGYNQDFNYQLQNIDFSNPIQQNSGLLPAANFVISVFNGLISNNPFSTLIIIVCILLIGKKVIGK